MGARVDGERILSPATVAAMTKAQRLPGISTQRGLGWDMRSPYSRVFNAAFPAGSFGHTGYTGTAMWIDPGSQTFVSNSHLPIASQRPRGCQTLAGQDRRGRGRGRAHGAAGAGNLN